MQSKILIVDDTGSNIDILVEMLDDYDILVATDGPGALEIVEQYSVDLILLDIMMPHMDGFEVCKILKSNEKHKNIPIIFLTAKSDDESISKGFELGGADYITKPFRAVELLSRLRAHLSLKKHEKILSEQKKFNALEQLIGNLVHHWRQPLAVISAMASGMSMEKEIGSLNDEVFYKNCDSIYNYTQELSLTLENLNSIIDTSSYDNKPTNLKELITLNHEKLFFDMENDDVNIILNIEENIIVNISSEQFIKSLYNLVQNTKNVFHKREIETKYLFIDARTNGDFVNIKIKDNAKGIDESIIEHIFEPYLTSEHQSFGKGLGLYSVHNIITNLFKGNISASNEKYIHDGEEYYGAVIDIELPV